MHHADVATFFFTGLSLEPGQYDCADLYAEHTELMQDAVTIYASQQPDDELQLPPAPRPSCPSTRSHVRGPLRERLRRRHRRRLVPQRDTLLADEVDETIYGKANRDFNINVPAAAVGHVEWTRCVFNKDVDVIFLSGHTHELPCRRTSRPDDAEAGGARVPRIRRLPCSRS